MRVVVAAIGALLLAGGIAVATLVPGGTVPAVWMVLNGSVLLIIAAIEVTRYRAGPGGGETERPEARFRPTDEVFVDPTTRRSMRVYADARTGERRYVAEG